MHASGLTARTSTLDTTPPQRTQHEPTTRQQRSTLASSPNSTSTSQQNRSTHHEHDVPHHRVRLQVRVLTGQVPTQGEVHRRDYGRSRTGVEAGVPAPQRYRGGTTQAGQGAVEPDPVPPPEHSPAVPSYCGLHLAARDLRRA